MSTVYYVVRYSGAFGFIKPWTAVRDGETASLSFLPPSAVTGISQKLFGIDQPAKITRNRLTFLRKVPIQETVHNRGWQIRKRSRQLERGESILVRHVLLEPVVWLAFLQRAEAEVALGQSICLGRNEDVLFPDEELLVRSAEEFDKLSGFECIPCEADHPDRFCIRLAPDGSPDYARLICSPLPLLH